MKINKELIKKLGKNAIIAASVSIVADITKDTLKKALKVK